MSYKTLLIIDNSSELTTLNRETLKETVKYIINNSEDDLAIAKTGENAEYIVEYDDSANTRLKVLEELEYTDITAPVTDLLMKVIMDWKDDDLAMREVLVISGSDTTKNAEYTLEELFFEINNKEYPVYTIACSQEGNDSCIKNLASISRISGGECFDINETESEADVGKQIGEKYLKAVKNRREVLEAIHEVKRESGLYEDEITEEAVSYDTENDENANMSDENHDTLTEDIPVAEEETVMDSDIIYTMQEPKEPSYAAFLVPVISVIVVLTVISIVMKIKRLKEEDESRRFAKRAYGRNIGNRNDDSDRLPFDVVRNNMTVALGGMNGYASDLDDDDGGTRLLYQGVEGVDLTLEDRNNPTKYYRVCLRDSIVIGRNEKLCDIAVNYDDSISGKHCEMYLRGDEVYCRDLDSSNGTMINQQKVYQEIRVESGDVLRIGRLSFYVQISRSNSGGVNV